MEQINLCPWFSILRSQRLRLCVLCFAAVVAILIFIASYSAYQVHCQVQRWEAATAVSQRLSQKLQHQQVQLAAWTLQAKNQLRQNQQSERNRENDRQILAFILALQRHIPAQVWLTRLSWHAGCRLSLYTTPASKRRFARAATHENERGRIRATKIFA